MYTLINTKDTLKGKVLYHIKIKKYNTTHFFYLTKRLILLDKIYTFYDETLDFRQLTYLGGNYKIPMVKLNEMDSFKCQINENELISTEKQEIARFIRKNGNIYPSIETNLIHLYPINTRVITALEELKKI